LTSIPHDLLIINDKNICLTWHISPYNTHRA
jgi:hypothetical protein